MSPCLRVSVSHCFSPCLRVSESTSLRGIRLPETRTPPPWLRNRYCCRAATAAGPIVPPRPGAYVELTPSLLAGTSGRDTKYVTKRIRDQTAFGILTIRAALWPLPVRGPPAGLTGLRAPHVFDGFCGHVAELPDLRPKPESSIRIRVINSHPSHLSDI